MADMPVAVGAILRYAVTAHVARIDLDVVGPILMIAGALGLVIGLWMMVFVRRRAAPPRP